LLCLIDFDVSWLTSERRPVSYDDTQHSESGTVGYMAPEVFTGNYNLKCDSFSIGAILYFMITRKELWFFD